MTLKREVCESRVTHWGSECLSVVAAMGTAGGKEGGPNLWSQRGWPWGASTTNAALADCSVSRSFIFFL